MIDQKTYDSYRMTVGIECHVQLRTKTKLFSGADNDARDREPNTIVSPLCIGLPGTLPVLNKEAVRLAILAGHALGSEVAQVSRFARKHYFYPDLPKGYQITQLAEPIIGAGSIDVPSETGHFKVRIHHAHMEEDAGKLTHPTGTDYSLVDLNRAGTPLIEIVSEPDMHSSRQAKAFAQELYLLMTYAGVTDGNLYHGNMRFDVNISVAKIDASALGLRVEVKNLNSFRSVEKAADYEFKRQVELIESGGSVVQETRGWSEEKQKTLPQRSKEDAHDYRYFPDADIPPIRLTSDEIELERSRMPMLPPEYRANWVKIGLNESVMNALLAEKTYALLIMNLQERNETAARRVANWCASAVVADEDTTAVHDLEYKETAFEALSDLVESNQLSSTAAKQVFNALLRESIDPLEYAQAQGLIQTSDTAEIEVIVDAVLGDPNSAKAIADIKAGNDKVIGFLVGQSMKHSKGKANPALLQQIIRKKLL